MKKIILLISFLILNYVSQATVHVVDSLNNSGVGSLRSKVSLASNGDTILFNSNLIANGSDSIVLTTEIAFSKDLCIRGLYTASDTLFLSGGGVSRVFNIQNSAFLVLDSLVLINGYTPFDGGAVNCVNVDSLNISNSTFRNNRSTVGGAVYSFANMVFSVGYGVAKMSVENCVFQKNIAVGPNARGGGIGFFMMDTIDVILEIKKSIFKNNVAGGNGGGVSLIGNLQARDILVYVEDSEIASNKSRNGAGIYSESYTSSQVEIKRSSIIENMGADSGLSRGMGVVSVSSNGFASVKVEESTISYNQSDSCLYGGGIHCSSNDSMSSVKITNSTIMNNSGIGVYRYGNFSFNHVFEVKSSILAFNEIKNFHANSITVMTSLGANIFSNTQFIGGHFSDQYNVDSIALNLTQLDYNGGFSRTMMPLSPSVAIDMGTLADVVDAQNAYVNGVRDIGAAELCYPTSATDTVVACDSYTWVNGVTYTSSNNWATYVVPNQAGCDSTITLKLTILPTTFGVDSIAACVSYVWNAVMYTSSNATATDTLVNQNGCDSIVTLNLTIHPEYQTTDVISACDSYTWINGITYTTSNSTDMDTLLSQFGCDSVITLDLTILNGTSSTDTISACGSYTWNGITYTSSNYTALDTLQNALGCDSIVTLNLTIYPLAYYTDVHMVCDSLVWIDGNTYFTGNTTATHTIVGGSVTGCDSIVTLDLTVNSNSSTHVISSCDSLTWMDGITYFSSTNTPTHLFTNSLGCDSVVTLDLTITNTTYGTDVITACNSYVWNGITYTLNNNTATDTLVNAFGCDSIITLELTILPFSTATDVISSCDPITWLDGNTYSVSNNTATHTITNTAGCDSVITLDFTLLQSTAGTDVISSCSEITWIDGNVYNVTTNGPTFTIPNAAGCDSVVTLDFTLLEVDTTVMRNYLTLTAQASNATYQWIDCNTGKINGETHADFTATQNGNYQVEITQNGCVDTSACFSITNVGIQQAQLLGVNVYPNPTSDVLHIDKGSNVSLEITVTNSAGAIVYHSSTEDQITTINMAKMASGVYVVTLRNELGVSVERIVKR